MAGQPTYPFEPKSNKYLKPGQFWGVPLSDGRWACARVLAVKTDNDAYFPGGSRIFLAALMDWSGAKPPTAEAIAGRNIVAQGWAHVRAIQYNGRLVLGERPLALDGIRGLLEVSHRSGGTVMLYEGATPLRPATRTEAATAPILGTWNVGVISALAERLFVKRLPLGPDPTVESEDEGKPRYKSAHKAPAQQLVLHLRRPRMSAKDKVTWEEDVERWIAAFDARLISEDLGEVGSWGRDGTLTAVYCYGPSAEALWQLAELTLASLTLSPTSTAMLRIGAAFDPDALEVTYSIGAR